MLTMLLGGLWHGAAGRSSSGARSTAAASPSSTGGRSERDSRASEPPSPPRGWPLAWRRLATFHVVCLGWVFFRAESLGDAFTLLGRIATGWTQAPELVGAGVLLAIASGSAHSTSRRARSGD